ncbi:hypothetical protein OIU74_028923 [Salix koriyanagi]|uniref:Uncharacterized protein n=1 Tax=Salix koriyanagi TaxID=2511006 RepID=A0A9Q0ZTU5_9ROSI|nr:hypothetical protein OIU74_028923 [Salix koriyanagi]
MRRLKIGQELNKFCGIMGNDLNIWKSCSKKHCIILCISQNYIQNYNIGRQPTLSWSLTLKHLYRLIHVSTSFSCDQYSSSSLDPKNLLTTAAIAPRNTKNTKVSNPPPMPTATLGPGAKNENGDQPQPP